MNLFGGEHLPAPSLFLQRRQQLPLRQPRLDMRSSRHGQRLLAPADQYAYLYV